MSSRQGGFSQFSTGGFLLLAKHAVGVTITTTGQLREPLIMAVRSLDGYSMQLLEQCCCYELRSGQQKINNFSCHGKTIRSREEGQLPGFQHHVETQYLYCISCFTPGAPWCIIPFKAILESSKSPQARSGYTWRSVFTSRVMMIHRS